MRYVAPSAQVREWFHQGYSRRAYEMLGAHPVEQDGVPMWHFAVWAPNARQVSLVGEFCGWDKTVCPMAKQFDGTWEVRLPASTFDPASNPEKYNYPEAGQKLKTYKFAILGADGAWHEKADPFGFAMQNRPNTASCLYDLEGYAWQDADWMKNRETWDCQRSPMNIYEVHLGSWRREGSTKVGDGLVGDGKDQTGRMLTYGEAADQLIPYVLDMGYTHIELLPVMEHPLDMSWGYQVSGYYAATARYGSPHDLMAFIDRCHQAGIGVILDWVPAHFPKDEPGLYQFDGTCCYELADPTMNEHPDWKTRIFDFGRYEVKSFLVSNVIYWLEKFHMDGIRVDAVSSMLYLDYNRPNYKPNRFGGKENLEAIELLRCVNRAAFELRPNAIMVAEESTAFPLITKPDSVGGLGFLFKWNMGWMNDTLSYMKTDPVYRKYEHNKLTFSMTYAFSENYVLPLSHDEVVHCKGSLINKMPGDYNQKFDNLRALYGYMMAHPGKKLTFMGSELAQFNEWNYRTQLDWNLLEFERHRQMQTFVRDLNRFYLTHPQLWQDDLEWEGYQWIQPDAGDDNLLAFRRIDSRHREVLVICNFCPVERIGYRLGVPRPGIYKPVLSSAEVAYGGTWTHIPSALAQRIPYREYKLSALFNIPPMSTTYYVRENPPKKRP